MVSSWHCHTYIYVTCFVHMVPACLHSPTGPLFFPNGPLYFRICTLKVDSVYESKHSWDQSFLLATYIVGCSFLLEATWLSTIPHASSWRWCHMTSLLIVFYPPDIVCVKTRACLPWSLLYLQYWAHSRYYSTIISWLSEWFSQNQAENRFLKTVQESLMETYG